jgi:hypothetical protein
MSIRLRSQKTYVTASMLAALLEATNQLEIKAVRQSSTLLRADCLNSKEMVLK